MASLLVIVKMMKFANKLYYDLWGSGGALSSLKKITLMIS